MRVNGNKSALFVAKYSPFLLKLNEDVLGPPFQDVNNRHNCRSGRVLNTVYSCPLDSKVKADKS